MQDRICLGGEARLRPAGRATPSTRAPARGLVPVGFTLVELLVVLAVIGVLLALMLPAVQAVRAAARRTGCTNNLHQIGIGLQHYHEARGSFPPGGIEPAHKVSGGRQFAWSAFLLPYVEQEALYERIDFQKPCYAPENAEAAATVVPMYLCPANRRGSNLSEGRGACDYGGLYGEAIPPNPTDGSWTAENGMMLYDRTLRIEDVRDGTSYTLVVSEDSDWRDGQWINGLNIFDQKYAINFRPPNPRFKENEIRSNHGSGANGVFCDGSVRFLNEDMDLRTLEAIITRAGGETVEEF